MSQGQAGLSGSRAKLRCFALDVIGQVVWSDMTRNEDRLAARRTQTIGKLRFTFQRAYSFMKYK